MKADRLGITITIIVMFWTLVLFVPLLQQQKPSEPVYQNPLPRPTNMDFDKCSVSTFKTVLPFQIHLEYENTGKMEFIEIHEKADTILVSQYTDYWLRFWSETPDNRYIQVSIDYPKSESHKIQIRYDSGEHNMNILALRNGTDWCKIFEIQNTKSSSEGKQ